MNLSPLHMWAHMGPMSKLVAGFLVLMAVAAVAVTVERLVAFFLAGRHTRRFVDAAAPLVRRAAFAELAACARENAKSPLARVVGPTLTKLDDEPGNVAAHELARRESERQREALASDLRRGMSVLASVGSVAPFVGLLGTVVGIITAFQGIATTGSGGLGAVSAGISEALVETALGLLVAIPAVLFFNALTTRVTAVEADVARSVSELLDRVESRHGRHDSLVVPRAA